MADKNNLLYTLDSKYIYAYMAYADANGDLLTDKTTLQKVKADTSVWAHDDLWKDEFKKIRSLKFTSDPQQATAENIYDSSKEATPIIFHTVSKTGSYDDLNNKPLIFISLPDTTGQGTLSVNDFNIISDQTKVVIITRGSDIYTKTKVDTNSIIYSSLTEHSNTQIKINKADRIYSVKSINYTVFDVSVGNNIFGSSTTVDSYPGNTTYFKKGIIANGNGSLPGLMVKNISGVKDISNVNDVTKAELYLNAPVGNSAGGDVIIRSASAGNNVYSNTKYFTAADVASSDNNKENTILSAVEVAKMITKVRATNTHFGGIKADQRDTSTDVQAVKIGTDGKLYTKASGSGPQGIQGWSVIPMKRTQNLNFEFSSWNSWVNTDTMFQYILNASEYRVNDICIFSGFISDIDNTSVSLFAKVVDISTASSNKLKLHGLFLVYGKKGVKGDTGAKGDSGKSIIAVDSSYSYTYSQWMGWGVPSYTGRWNVSNTNGAKVGDIIMLSGVVSDRNNSRGLIIGTATIVDTSAITIQSYGFICQGEKGDKGDTGPQGPKGLPGHRVTVNGTNAIFSHATDSIITGQLTNETLFTDEDGTTYTGSSAAGRVFVDVITNKNYKWNGTKFEVIGAGLELGETSTTAYAGSKGKANRDEINLLKTNKQDQILAGDNISIASDNKTINWVAPLNGVYFERILDKYLIKWNNYDNSLLFSEKVVEGQIPQYKGTTPAKSGNAQYSYTFKGWTPEVVEVTKEATYTATFNEIINRYKVTWANYDGSILKEEPSVAYGTVPSYSGATPTKPSDDKYDYTFSSWKPIPVTITSAMTYTAEYTKKEKALRKPNINDGFFGDDSAHHYRLDQLSSQYLEVYNGVPSYLVKNSNSVVLQSKAFNSDIVNLVDASDGRGLAHSDRDFVEESAILLTESHDLGELFSFSEYYHKIVEPYLESLQINNFILSDNIICHSLTYISFSEHMNPLIDSLNSNKDNYMMIPHCYDGNSLQSNWHVFAIVRNQETLEWYLVKEEDIEKVITDNGEIVLKINYKYFGASGCIALLLA